MIRQNSIPSALINWLTDQVNVHFISLSPLSGGDISSVFKMKTPQGFLVLKVNSSPIGYDLLKAEKEGLETIQQTQTIKTPTVLFLGQKGQDALLVMEFIPSQRPTPINFEQFGYQLAQMHQHKGKAFGHFAYNYIGSLPQSNHNHHSWSQFYVEERLWPQIQLALSKKLLSPKEVPPKSQLFTYSNSIFGNPQPVLLHGDLWSGNFLISTNNEPYLIDPAVYYGHAEVDIAMTQLFGGFSAGFYESYFGTLPPDQFTPQRINWYQLYYLLVHLNLFGSAYYAQVLSKLNVV